MRFAEEYQGKVNDLNQWKHEVENRTTDIMKYHAKLPITIGNMVYSVLAWDNKEVPAYMYERDYVKGNNNFYPIWDREETTEFGWSDFAEVTRIFDLITNTILNKK